MTASVYVLHADGNKDVTLEPDLTYFQTHFIAEPMAQGWHPPSARIIGKTKRLRDFVSWMNSAPVISPAATEVLRPLIGAHCELLPLVELRGELYSAVNVPTTVNCLAHARSQIVYSTDDPDHILYD